MVLTVLCRVFIGKSLNALPSTYLAKIGEIDTASTKAPAKMAYWNGYYSLMFSAIKSLIILLTISARFEWADAV